MGAKETSLYTSDMLAELVEAKYAQPAYVTIREARDATGFGASRSADVMAFGVWPSRGLSVIGFELKSYRNDWLRELKNPEKAETIMPYCDEWYVVAAEGVVNAEEVPKTWGWLAPRGRGLRALKPSALPEARQLDRSFLMSILRNVTRSYVPKDQLDELAKRRTDAALDAYKAQDSCRFDRADKLEKSVKDFEEASGITINSWSYDSKETGNIVRLVLDKNLHYHTKNLVKAAQQVREAHEALLAHPFYRAAAEKQ